MASTRMRTWISLTVALLVLLQLGAQVDGESDALAFVKKTVSAHPLVIFSKSYCPYCQRAKSVFDGMNEKPFVIELNEREDGDAIQQALGKFIGRRTVPQVFINGEHIGGSDDTVAAQQSGRLKSFSRALPLTRSRVGSLNYEPAGVQLIKFLLRNFLRRKFPLRKFPLRKLLLRSRKLSSVTQEYGHQW